jgi:hypothetical protein
MAIVDTAHLATADIPSCTLETEISRAASSMMEFFFQPLALAVAIFTSHIILEFSSLTNHLLGSSVSPAVVPTNLTTGFLPPTFKYWSKGVSCSRHCLALNES